MNAWRILMNARRSYLGHDMPDHTARLREAISRRGLPPGAPRAWFRDPDFQAWSSLGYMQPSGSTGNSRTQDDRGPYTTPIPNLDLQLRQSGLNEPEKSTELPRGITPSYGDWPKTPSIRDCVKYIWLAAFIR